MKTKPTKEEEVSNGWGSSRTLFATATLEGTLQLGELKRAPYWELRTGNGQLCALRLMDMVGDGQDEIVACWWDGTTVIADKERNIAVFKFEDRVSAFLCGNFAVRRAHSEPCFVYVTLFGEIVVYPGVRLESVAVRTLSDIAGGTGWDRRELPALFHNILYDVNLEDAREYVAQLKAKLAQVESENRAQQSVNNNNK